MSLLRIREVVSLPNFHLRLTLTDGSVVERDVSGYLQGPIFEPIRSDASLFSGVRVEHGTVVWPNGADLCPDALIWGGLPPENATRPDSKPQAQSKAQGST